MNRLVLSFIAVFLPLTIAAQARKIKGEFIYYSDPNMSPKEAMAAAIENARVQAIAKEFGTFLIQFTNQEEYQEGDKEYSSFMQLNAAEVKGEWLEDTKKPKVKIIDTTDEGVLVIKAEVEGRAKAITNEAAEFDVSVLRNGKELRNADTEFKEGDRMFLYFKAPADGYIAAYLIDGKQTVSCLLPHENDNDGQQPVKHNQEYVFFSESNDADFLGKDGLKVLCDDNRIELNRIYIIYSPNSFVKANDQPGPILEQNLYRPRQLSLKDFTRWMSRLCSRDNKMGRKVIQIKIRKS